MGATKSAFVNLKFQLTVNKNQIIETEDFEIHIKNSRNSKLFDNFKAGTLLKNDEQNVNSCFIFS